MGHQFYFAPETGGQQAVVWIQTGDDGRDMRHIKEAYQGFILLGYQSPTIPFKYEDFPFVMPLPNHCNMWAREQVRVSRKGYWPEPQFAEWADECIGGADRMAASVLVARAFFHFKTKSDLVLFKMRWHEDMLAAGLGKP